MHEDEQLPFGQLLKSVRLDAGLTQEALAERAGLSIRGIQDLERGVTRPLKDTARRLIGALVLDGPARARFEAAAGPAPRRRENTQAAAPGGQPAQPAQGAPMRGTLPTHLTPVIGREAEITRIGIVLARTDQRLLTLTGPGGVGKTRLAIEAAEQFQRSFAANVVFVGLATILDSSLVPETIAQALGVREVAGQGFTEAIVAFLQPRQFLLLLDNFEHLTEASLLVRDLLAACPQLQVLVTSRSALRIRGEQVFPVPPLEVPPAEAAGLLTASQGSPAVTLFVARARDVDPDFALTADNAAPITAICRRLEGLPLAIELAAARGKYLSPQALLARLVPSLPVLTGGARDLPHRQQTLRAAIAWSYDLLPEETQRVFRVLALFSGGCTIDSAMAACAPGDPARASLLDHLDALVAASLVATVEQQDGEPRFTMLETIREFGKEQVLASGEQPALQERHALRFLEFAEESEPHVRGVEVASWLDRLEWEHDNFRAALAWIMENGSAVQAIRLTGALWGFWYLRSHLTEGRRGLEAALAWHDAVEVAPAMRTKALYGASVFAIEQGDQAHAAELLEEALVLHRQMGDSEGISSILNVLALSARHGGDFARAMALHEESLAMARAAGNSRGMAMNLLNLGVIARQTGEHARAIALYEESHALYLEIGDHLGVASALTNLAEVVRDQGDSERARQLYRESLPIHQLLGHKQGVAESLEGLAWVARIAGRLEAAARVLGAASALRAAIGFAHAEGDRAWHQRELETLRTAMATEAADTSFEEAWEAGGRLTPEQAAAEALTAAGIDPV